MNFDRIFPLQIRICSQNKYWPLTRSIGSRSEREESRAVRQRRPRKMGALCLLPSTPPCCSCGAAGGGGSPSRTPRLARTAAPFASSSSSSGAASSGGGLQLACRRRRAGVARGGGGKGDGGASGGAEFFGEDGVVEDMDGYLNYLSLEYDSVWDTKPSWYGFLVPRFLQCKLKQLELSKILVGQSRD